MSHLYYFYPGLIILGLSTSFTDIKSKLIYNKQLFFGLIYGLVAYIYLYLTNSIRFPLALLFMNMLISFCMAYLLYYKSIWAAGDAKLFIVISFLNPSLKYDYLFQCPVFAIFANVNMLAFIYIVITEFRKILNTGFNDNASFLKKESKKFATSLLFVFSITWLVWHVFSKMHIANPIVKTALLFGSYFIASFIFSKFKTKKIITAFVIIIGFALRVYLQPYMFLSFGFMAKYIATSIKYTLLFLILDFLVSSLSKNEDGSKSADRISFAPFIFIGAILTESPLISWAIELLSKVTR